MLEITRSPIPGSPRMGYYIIDDEDEDFEDGPYMFLEGAEEAMAEHDERGLEADRE